jgi:hypothetical protein
MVVYIWEQTHFERFWMQTDVVVICAVAYLDLLLGEGETQIFSLFQAQNLQVNFLVIFKSGKSLIFVVFFNYF